MLYAQEAVKARIRIGVRWGGGGQVTDGTWTWSKGVIVRSQLHVQYKNFYFLLFVWLVSQLAFCCFFLSSVFCECFWSHFLIPFFINCDPVLPLRRVLIPLMTTSNLELSISLLAPSLYYNINRYANYNAQYLTTTAL